MPTLQAALSNQPWSLLLASDNPDDLIQVRHLLEPVWPHLQIQQAGNEDQLAEALAQGKLDLALLEARLPWADSLAVMRAIHNRWPDCPLVVIADEQSEKVVHEAIQAGLAGYVPRVSGQIIGLPLVMRLVLEHTRQVTFIEETLTRYRRLFDTIPLGLYHTMPSGQILEANLSLIQMLGYPDRAAMLAFLLQVKQRNDMSNRKDNINFAKMG